MSVEIADIQPNDIEFYKDILKLDEDFKLVQLYENFRSLSRSYHPAVKPSAVDRFERLNVAFEVLNYLYTRQKSNTIENLLNDWNRNEKAKFSQKIAYYKSLNLESYTKKIEYNPFVFKLRIFHFHICIHTLIDFHSLSC